MSAPKVIQRSPLRQDVSLGTVDTDEINVEPSGPGIIGERLGRKTDGVGSPFAE